MVIKTLGVSCEFKKVKYLWGSLEYLVWASTLPNAQKALYIHTLPRHDKVQILGGGWVNIHSLNLNIKAWFCLQEWYSITCKCLNIETSVCWCHQQNYIIASTHKIVISLEWTLQIWGIQHHLMIVPQKGKLEQKFEKEKNLKRKKRNRYFCKVKEMIQVIQ